MADRRIVEANQPFSVTLPSGAPLVVSKGDRYYDDDPVVRQVPGAFGELTVKSSVPPSVGAVETATAGPGERRTLTRPPGRPRGARQQPTEPAQAKTEATGPDGKE